MFFFISFIIRNAASASVRERKKNKVTEKRIYIYKDGEKLSEEFN